MCHSLDVIDKLIEKSISCDEFQDHAYFRKERSKNCGRENIRHEI